MRISLIIIGAIKVLCWANNVIDLPVCTFFGSELATEIPPAGLKRDPFVFAVSACMLHNGCLFCHVCV